MTQPPPRLQIPAEPSPLPAPDEVSILVREFARPLLYADPAGPADLETLRTSVLLAMICWNLPVYEATGSPLFQKGTATLAQITKSVPRSVAKALDQLIVTRKTRYAAQAFLVTVEVQGDALAQATIAAEARRPKPRV